MNKKSTLVAMLVLVVACLTACGSGSHGSMFGGIPGIYEKKLVEVAKDLKEMSDKMDGNIKVAMDALAKLQSAYEEAEEEAKPIADQMVGKEVKVETEDNLPFKVVGNAKVNSVKLPEMEKYIGGNRQMSLELSFEAEATKSMQQKSRQYYFLMDGETPISYGRTTLEGLTEGKSVNVTMTVSAPKAPAEQVDRCSSIKFVSRETYDAQKDAIDKQLEEWFDNMVKDLGLDK